MSPRIALISLYDHQAFGIRSLHSVLKKNDIQAFCIFYKYSKFKTEPSSDKELDTLIRHLKDLSVDIVGISVFSSFFKEAAKLTDRIKIELNIPVFWEGFHATVMPQECIKFADFVFIGEIEETLLKFINNWGRIYSLHIPGLWTKRKEGIIKDSTPQLVENLNDLPMLDFGDTNKYYIEEDELFWGDPIYNKKNFQELYGCRYHILSSRGCPYECSYCCNPVSKNLYSRYGNSYIRRRNVNSVIKELRFVKGHLGANSIIFADSCFATDIKWVSDFCKSYKEEINLPFYCEMHPEIITEESISMLCNAGLVDTCIGIQSGSERIRNRYFNRPISDKLFLDKTKLLKKYNIGIHYEIIIDNPYEGESDKHETLKLLLNLPRPLKLNVFSLNFLPESKITKMALNDGLITEEDVEGRSDRGMRQFILKKPKDAKDKFWSYIYFLASDYYCVSGNIRGLRDIFSRDFIHFLSNLKLTKKYQWIFTKSIDLVNGFILFKRKIINYQNIIKRYIPQRPILFLRILIFSCFMPILINFIEPVKLLKILESKKGSDIDNKRLAKIIKYVDFILNLWPWHSFKNICLIRSVILYYFLSHEGLNVKINFGIKKEADILKGHGWLTLNGEPYLEQNNIWQDFEVIHSFPSQS